MSNEPKFPGGPGHPGGPAMSPADKIRMEGQMKTRRYRGLNGLATKGGIVLAGSSLMEFFPVNELMMNRQYQNKIYNRGLGGFTTSQYMEVVEDCILGLEPGKLFINIGTNDIGLPGDWTRKLTDNYRAILQKVIDKLPECRIYVMAYYPVMKTDEPFFTPGCTTPRTIESVAQANAAIEAMANEMGLRFININHAISTEDGYLRPEFADDPVHMLPPAYEEILTALIPYFEE